MLITARSDAGRSPAGALEGSSWALRPTSAPAQFYRHTESAAATSFMRVHEMTRMVLIGVFGSL
jgi:hypothetical protein